VKGILKLTVAVAVFPSSSLFVELSVKVMAFFQRAILVASFYLYQVLSLNPFSQNSLEYLAVDVDTFVVTSFSVFSFWVVTKYGVISTVPLVAIAPEISSLWT